MSTRANIVIKSGREKLFFYKHSDGYPSGTMPLLETLLNRVKSGEYRDNVGQFSGWLIIEGRKEFINTFDKSGVPEYYNWKCGDIEPTTCIHGDIEYLYTIDLVKKTITTKEV